MDLDTAVAIALQMKTDAPQTMWDLAVDEKVNVLSLGGTTSEIKTGTNDKDS